MALIYDFILNTLFTYYNISTHQKSFENYLVGLSEGK